LEEEFSQNFEDSINDEALTVAATTAIVALSSSGGK